jgi:hypothetical protein
VIDRNWSRLPKFSDHPLKPLTSKPQLVNSVAHHAAFIGESKGFAVVFS